MVKETETEVETPKVPRKAVAEHELLKADGTAAESEDEATGISYKLKENGKAFSWQWGEANDAERIMLACFGAKTLATNVTSAARNNEKNPADADGQFAALTERFAIIRGGQWLDPTREPGAPRVDKDKLAEAIIQVMVTGGKLKPEDVASATAEKRARLDTDPAWMASVRTFTPVADAYNKLIGKKTATLDDL